MAKYYSFFNKSGERSHFWIKLDTLRYLLVFRLDDFPSRRTLLKL